MCQTWWYILNFSSGLNWTPAKQEDQVDNDQEDQDQDQDQDLDQDQEDLVDDDDGEGVAGLAGDGARS